MDSAPQHCVELVDKDLSSLFGAREMRKSSRKNRDNQRQNRELNAPITSSEEDLER